MSLAEVEEIMGGQHGMKHGASCRCTRRVHSPCVRMAIPGRLAH
jgi:hypothetical protein